MTNLKIVSVGIVGAAVDDCMHLVMGQPEAMCNLMTKTKKGNALDQTI